MFRLALGLALFLVAFGNPVSAQVEATPSKTAAKAGDRSSDSDQGRTRGDELDRWVPSVGVSGGFQEQSADGLITPGVLEGPQCIRTGTQCLIPQQIQPGAAGSDNLRRFQAGFPFELMTPRMLSRFGDPRLFVHADPVYGVGFRRRVAGSGDPGPMIEGDLPPSASRSDAAAYSGQGTRLDANLSPFVINAGLGMAFTFELFDTRIRVKPSAEFMSERLSITGQVNRVVQVAQIPAPNTPSDFRFISLRAVDRETYYGLGPGLEIEYDANRLGPFTVTPFAAARAYHLFGNLRVKLRDENEYGEYAEWRFNRDQWQWVARFGVRLRWDPER